MKFLFFPPLIGIYFKWNLLFLTPTQFFFTLYFIYKWAETDLPLLGLLERVIKKHGGQTEAKISIFKDLLLNSGKALGVENSLMDMIFNAKETDQSGKLFYNKSSHFTVIEVDGGCVGNELILRLYTYLISLWHSGLELWAAEKKFAPDIIITKFFGPWPKIKMSLRTKFFIEPFFKN